MQNMLDIKIINAAEEGDTKTISLLLPDATAEKINKKDSVCVV